MLRPASGRVNSPLSSRMLWAVKLTLMNTPPPSDGPGGGLYPAGRAAATAIGGLGAAHEAGEGRDVPGGRGGGSATPRPGQALLGGAG